MSTDGYHIFYNPQWTKTLSPEEIAGVLAHETLHVVFGHADRRAARNALLWNIACDYAINELLLEHGFTLPLGGLVDRRFRFLVAEKIYEKLVKQDTAISEIDPEYARDILDVDDIRVRPYQDEELPDEEQRRQLRRAFTDEIRSHLHGTEAAYLAEEIQRAKSKEIPWFDLLRQWLTSTVRTEWRSYPFARKSLWRGIYLPSVGVLAPEHIVFAIDTSGSMSNEDLSMAAAELQFLRDSYPCALTVVQCDVKIHQIASYAEQEPLTDTDSMHIVGRGGTDLRPVFAWVQAECPAHAPVVVYVTDGFGPFPEYTVTTPVFWVVPKGGRDPNEFPFGVVVPVG